MRSLLLVGSRVPNPQAFGSLLRHHQPRPLSGLRAGSSRGASNMAISYLSAEEVKAILEGCVSDICLHFSLILHSHSTYKTARALPLA